MPVPPNEGLRPTPDRLRETLFNWLRPLLPGAHCLDLYAGSGALGIEAVSQGAADALLVEQDPVLCAGLAPLLQTLDPAALQLLKADALAWLRAGPGESPACPGPFDLVFIDPPYSSKLLLPSCEALGQNGWLKPGALVFLELGDAPEQGLPADWRVMKRARAGRVAALLLRAGLGTGTGVYVQRPDAHSNERAE